MYSTESRASALALVPRSTFLVRQPEGARLERKQETLETVSQWLPTSPAQTELDTPLLLSLLFLDRRQREKCYTDEGGWQASH